MPLLGVDYARFVADRIEMALPEIAPVDVSQLERAFKSFGHRPEPFLAAMARELVPFHEGASFS